MLTIQNISFSYGKSGKPVLENYTLSVEAGSICGLLGKNGAGKSTLLYLVCGLLKAQNGSIIYNGFTPWERKTDFLNDVFIVPEEILLPNISLDEYVSAMAPFYPRFSKEDLYSYLETFELPSQVHLSQLSMGQKKRVFISFALACNTSLLILDEPTNGLDIPGKRLFRKAVVKSMTDEKTIIISTHQVYDVEKILDQIIITDTDGVKLDAKLYEITSRLAFRFTPDRNRAEKALISLDAPGGFNIVERVEDGDETDVNLETLFELCRENPAVIESLFNVDK